MWIFWKLQNQQPCTRTSSRRMWARIYSMISINYHQDKRPVMREMKWIWFSIRCILINWHYSFGWCSIPLKFWAINWLTMHSQNHGSHWLNIQSRGYVGRELKLTWGWSSKKVDPKVQGLTYICNIWWGARKLKALTRLLSLEKCLKWTPIHLDVD